MKPFYFCLISFCFCLHPIFAQVPVINSFTPISGNVGSSVTITGSNFSSVSSENIVFFGSVKASVISATPSSLTVSIPPGATYRPISITVNNLTAFSAVPFTVTFTGGGINLTSNSFTNTVSYTTGPYPRVMSLSDFNLDGKSDIVIANTNSANILIYKNTGSGNSLSFSSVLNLATGTGPQKMVTNDIDGDGMTDIIVSNFNAGGVGSISVFRNISASGNIAFAPKVDFVTGNGSLGVGVSDIDYDGKPDIVVCSGNSGIFSVFRNTGTPGNISFAPRVDFTHLQQGNNLSLNDIDSDGKIDVVLANFSGSNFSVHRNLSTPGIISFSAQINFAAGSNPNGVVGGDLNGDGKPDIAVVNFSSRSISIFKNTGNNSIAFDLAIDSTTGKNPRSVSIGDIDGDGKPDLLIGYGDTLGNVSVYRNTSVINGAISFAPRKDYNGGNDETLGEMGDLNSDGKPEIIISCAYVNTLTILKNKIGEIPTIQFCPPSASGAVSISNVANNYQWQADMGSGFNNINNNANYSGTTAATLQLINIPSSWNGFKYRCIFDSNFSETTLLKFINVWTGAVNSNWENPSNWSCGTIPDNYTDVIINNGIVFINSNVVIRSLIINPPGSLTVMSGNTLTTTN